MTTYLPGGTTPQDPPATGRKPSPQAPLALAKVRPGLVLAIVLIGQFMAVLDASIVNVAAPSIHASLHASGASLQLIVAGYTITYAVLLVTGARLGGQMGWFTCQVPGREKQMTLRFYRFWRPEVEALLGGLGSGG